MGIADLIATKRNELAHFVTESAQAVLSEQMTDAARGAVALDLLRLMVSSGLSATTGPMLDVSPAQHRKLSPYERKPAPTDDQIAEALAATGDDMHRAAKVLGCTHVAIIGYMKRAPAAAPVPEAPLPTTPVVEDVAAAEPAPQAEVVKTTHSEASAVRVRARRFTDEQLLAAVAEHGNDTGAIASLLNIGPSVVNMHRRRLGCPAPKGKARPIVGLRADMSWVVRPVEWSEANRARLIDMATGRPRPSALQIAEAFGTTEAAINTAMSRFGVQKMLTVAKRDDLKDVSAFKRRNCMSCERPFLSEGNWNRRCDSCKSADDQVAA